MSHSSIDMWIDEIKTIMESARHRAVKDVNTFMLETYWQIGKSIVAEERSKGNG